MDVVPRRFLQSKSEGCALPLNVPSENRNQREVFELDPRRRARAENGSTERGRETKQESARKAHSAVSEMKDCTSKDPMKPAGNDAYRSHDTVHPACCDKKGSSPREKSKRTPHHFRESTGADLDPDATAKDSMPISSLPQLERTEANERMELQMVGAKPHEGRDAAPIPVRITSRAHEVWQTLGSFTVPRMDAVLKLPSVAILPIESSDPEPQEKRKKTATASNQLSNIWGADSVLDKEKLRGDETVNRKKHELGGKWPENRFPAKGEEVGKGADSVLDKEKLRGDEKVNRKKHELGGKWPENRFPAKGEEVGKKRESRKSSGNVRDDGHRSSRISRSGSTASSAGRVSDPRGRNTGRTRKDDLASELSRCSALSERDRQRRQRHREKRSAAILAKRDKLLKIYKMDCEAFATVAKQLIAQDASLEERVALAVKKNLQLMGERCLSELKETIAKWDAANVLKKRR